MDGKSSKIRIQGSRGTYVFDALGDDSCFITEEYMKMNGFPLEWLKIIQEGGMINAQNLDYWHYRKLCKIINTRKLPSEEASA